MKFDWEKIKQKNTVINCKTEEQAKLLFEFLKEKGITWASKSPSTFWYDEKEKTCYNVDGIYLSYDSNEYFLNNNYTILEFEDVVIQDKPKICEILGVDVNELFELRTSGQNIPLEFKYYITEDGQFIAENNFNSPNMGLETINGKFKIVKLPKYTDEQKEIFKALKTLGYNYIARDSDYIVCAYEKKPVTKTKYYWSSENIISFNLETDKILNNPHLNFVNWEDEEPFEIPEV